MKVGDYVRTDKGEIGKLKELELDYTTGKRLVTYYTYREVKENFIMFDNTNITQRFVDGSCYYLTDDELKQVEESIIKSSPNIIDLIEVGDYVNGHKVNYINKDREHFNISFGDEGFNLKSKFNSDIYWLSKEDIESIVTKEQFETMEYKLEE